MTLCRVTRVQQDWVSRHERPLMTETSMNNKERNSTNSRTPNETESTTKQMLEALMMQNNMLIELLKVQLAKPVNE